MDKTKALEILKCPPDSEWGTIDQAYKKQMGRVKQLYQKSEDEEFKTKLQKLARRLKTAHALLEKATLTKSEPVPEQVSDQIDQTEQQTNSAYTKLDIEDSTLDDALKQFIESQQTASFSWLSIGAIAALILCLFIGVGVYTGILQSLWQQYRPLSEIELAAKEESAALIDTINVLQTDFDQSRNALTQQIKEAGATRLEPQYSMLLETLDLADRAVYKNPTFIELQEQTLAAQQDLQNRDYLSAKQKLKATVDDYKSLKNTLEEVEQVVPEKYAALGARQDWDVIQNEYSPLGLKTPSKINLANEQFMAGESNVLELSLSPAIDNFGQAKGLYLDAQNEVADEISAIQARLTAAREKRKASQALSPEQLAWLKQITPTMVDIPAGSFVMGSDDADPDEQPRHKVWMSAFRISKHEITRQRFLSFIQNSTYVTEAEKNSDGLGCAVFGDDGSWSWRQDHNWNNVGFPQTEQHPAVCLSWNDATAYVQWLNQVWKGTRHFRLITESEWEYVARAGTNTPYPSGDDVGNNLYNCDGCRSQWDVKGSAPANSFPLNAFGVHAMIGNVFEWTQDCWHDNYQGAPRSNSAWLNDGECGKHVLRGGSWFSKPKFLRSAYRSHQKASYRSNNLGFRITEHLK